MSFSPSAAVKNLVDKYQTGNKQTEGLGAELGARGDMNRAAEGALPKMASTTKPVAEPEKHVTPKPKDMYGARGAEKRIDTSTMTPVLGSFKDGGKVKKTGAYILHKDEEVTPKEKTGDKMESPYAMVTGGKKPKKEIKEMVHSKSHNGKHIVTHKHHSPMHHPDEIHTFEDMQGVHDHMDAHDQGADGAAPMTASPSPMPEAAAPAAPGAAAGM